MVDKKQPSMIPDYPDADATDLAHPAWWRGNDAGVASVCVMLHELIDGRQPQGVCGYEPLELLRQRIWELVQNQAM